MATSDRTDSTLQFQLSNGYTGLIDAEDADLLRVQWQPQGRNERRWTYAARTVRKGKGFHRLRMHRVIVERMIGRPLARNEVIDHINGDTLDNRRCNLRPATRSQNNANSRLPVTNTSGYKGVFYKKEVGRWRASISVKNRTVYLGVFDTPEEAHAAYIGAARVLFGEFAKFG